MSRLRLEQVLDASAADLSLQSGESLLRLKTEALAKVDLAKAVADQIDRGVELKYRERARRLRLDADKDTGVIHFDDGMVRITADLPKKVEWDQKRLADITRRIAANGEDPTQYVEISYRVSETKFGAWPESIKGAFVAARTLKTGKPTFRLVLNSGENT